jgi:hypothetical protein
MYLQNHCVKKILLDDVVFIAEVVECFAAAENVDIMASSGLDRYNDLMQMLSAKHNKTYYVTKSVIDKLELLDTKKCMNFEGWKLFKSIPDFKKTFILPDPPPSYAKYGGSCFLRVIKSGDILQFFHCTCKFLPPEKRTRTTDSQMYFVVLYVDMEKGTLCEHFQSNDGKDLAPLLYTLMCFTELCDNQIIEIAPKRQYGTRKEGKLINIFPFPITVINNTWNVTRILTGTILVTGHAQIYWTGAGRTIPKLIYKEPYSKEGYILRAGKDIANTKQTT